ncbi:hypothetical protein [Streptomyces violascens]|uniref:Integral membrane protein n=1 Tax=Streptomyces violascens TaxID=67381 RepID=A0ABQ3R1A6_9ACTN|nr:hypothetical protein [Streptomyces violascens]GGU10676.1 hypothetical protein GCM10010289_34890 [Streptomyces violascens]GHI43312.1 hypothetical protein Sviol_77200 [Streptomyces violascens]
MSQPVTPPPQPSGPEPDFGYPAAPVAPTPVRGPGNLVGGALAGFAAAVVTGLAYGLITGAIERQFGYAAFGIGFAVALAAFKVGGRSFWLFVISAPLAVGATFFGQLLAVATIETKGTSESVTDVFLSHFGVLLDAWSHDQSILRYGFLALAVVGAWAGASRATE